MSDAPDDDLLRRTVGEAEAVRAAFETMPVPLAAFDGSGFVFVAANAGYRDFTGRPEVVGLAMRDVFPEVAGQQLFEMMERVYSTGVAQVADEWRLQFVVDETGVPQDRFVNFTISPRRSSAGAVVGVNVQIIDVTTAVRARQAAQARAAAAERRYEQVQDVFDVLQRALLPAGLPVLPEVDIAASYLLADADTAAGGDWFDACPLPDGRVALVVGDVVGHGVAASAVMGQLRAVLADRLSDGADPATVLAAVDRMALRTRGARAATVCLAVLDPRDGTLQYCTAGHPPPLVVPTGGEARYLPTTGAGPLGTGSAFPMRTARLDIGDALLLYSDGIVERPGRDAAASTVELAQVAADVAAGRALRSDETSTAERLTGQTLELLIRATGHADDVTLLAAQRREPVADLRQRLPAEAGSVRAARHELRRWLAAVDVRGDDVMDVQHAIGEVVTNAVEHAYLAGAAGDVDVHVVLTTDGELLARISDAGRWRSDSSGPHRGRGLAMSRDLVDAVEVDHGLDGTSILLRHRLSRPVRLLTAIGRGGVTPPVGVEAEFSLHGDPDLVVTGPVDAATAPLLHRELARRTRGGTRPLRLDLTGVTHLASAGVAVLYSAANPQLRLVSPAGSVAQHVLSLVALPHEDRAAGTR